MAVFLVTGGAGFIGSNIVEKLIKDRHQVKVLDNFSTGKRSNIAGFRNKITLIEGDIRNKNIVEKAMEQVDFVLHQAALPSVPRSVRDPLSTNAVNVEGTLNLLLVARDKKVKRFVYAGSSSAYGDTPTLPKKEQMTPNPLSPYAVSKLTGEHYGQVFWHVFGLETVILRYFNVFGPRQDPTSQYAAVVPKFIEALLSKRPPVIYGDGEQSRDFTYIDNVVEANILACFAPGAGGEVINIACNKRITINELAKKLIVIIKVDIEPEYAESRPGDVKHSLASIDKAKKILGYKPKVDFEQGLKKTVEWYKSYRYQQKKF